MAKMNVNIRLATDEDYEAVMDINRNVYRGRDYLPAKYHEFIQAPTMYAYVAEYGQQIVIIWQLVFIDRTFCFTVRSISMGLFMYILANSLCINTK